MLSLNFDASAKSHILGKFTPLIATVRVPWLLGSNTLEITLTLFQYVITPYNQTISYWCVADATVTR
jgi:hypothetical protein